MLLLIVLVAALAAGAALAAWRTGLRDERGQSMSIETVVIIGIAVVLAVAVGAWAVTKLTDAQSGVPDPSPPAIGG